MPTFHPVGAYPIARLSCLWMLSIPVALAQTPDATTLPTIEVRASPLANAYAAPDASVGGKEPLPLRQIPQSVSVITGQRIEDQNLGTVSEALGQATGVTIIANDSTQSQMRARGYSLGVAHDGVPAYGALSGYQQFDLAMFDRVEVLRGPAGIFTGSGDPGGVVNLVSKRASAAPASTLSASLGSWNHRRVTVDATGPLNDEATVRARGVFSLLDRDYFYDKTHTRRWLAYGTLEWDIDRATMLTLTTAVQDDDTEAPSSGLPAWSTGELIDAPRHINTIADWTHYRWRTRMHTAELQRRFGTDWVFKAKLSLRPQDFYFKDGYPTTGVERLTGTMNYARRVRDYAYGREALDLYATGPFELWGRQHKVVAGYHRERFSSAYEGANADPVTGASFGRSNLVPDFDLPYDLGGKTRTTQSGWYGQARLSVTDALTVALGGRLSDWSSRSRDAEPAAPTPWRQGARVRDEFTPSAAVLLNLGRHWTAYGSYSAIFIPQTALSADGRMLDPRVGGQFELGAKGEFLDGRLQASLTLFRLRDRNRAYPDPLHEGYYVAAGQLQSQGWEAELVGRPAPGWDVQLGYTRLDTKYRRDAANQGLPFTTWEPRHTLKLWGVHHFSEGALGGLSLGGGARVVSASAAGNGNSAIRRQGGYAVVDAMANWRIGTHWVLGLHLNNVFDRTYYTRLGGLNTYNTYGEPRNIAVTLSAQL